MTTMSSFNRIVALTYKKSFLQLLIVRNINSSLPISIPELDLDYICDPNNTNEIRDDIARRPNTNGGNIDKVIELNNLLKSNDCKQTRDNLIEEAIKLPNKTCPSVRNLTKPKILEEIGCKQNLAAAKSLEEAPPKVVIPSCRRLLRTERIGTITGPRTYYLTGALAKLEQALVNYSLKKLIEKGFSLISVPDLIHSSVVNACGMNTEGERTQVYFLNPEICLSGTAEMALAAYFANQTQLMDHLPLKVAAVSRCYRSEVTKMAKERGLYRVRNFTKVEMFGVTADETNEEGDELLNDFVSIQKELFTELGLHFQVLEMPPQDLGAPTYKKIDIEAWMPGRKLFGEISSASNCTTYQSRRFAIKYNNNNNELKHCQTTNGTACAVPRIIIALTETHQKPDGSVVIPRPLIPYMGGLKEIKEEKLPKLNWVKNE
uniref:serine--tRNA ligase n=1 Tax=Strigamia maritima TaxID=126957 RepID=T1IRP7_STRMM